MTEEQKNKENAEAKEPETEATPAKKSGFVKYLLFGGAGIILLVGVALVTLLLVRGDGSQPASGDISEEVADAPTKNDSSGMLDSLSSENLDQNAMDKIMENLAVLDYEPTPGEIEGAGAGMSVQDSLMAVNWLKREKEALAQKESGLDARQKKLDRLDEQLSQKVLRIEQAQSARINSLAKLYDGMDSKSVARLMANLDDETIVSILPRMKTKNASAVLQLLPPRRAAKLSKRMITIAEK